MTRCRDCPPSRRGEILKKILLLLLGTVLLFFFAACTTTPETPETPEPPATPEGIISAKDWEKDHPDIYASYQRNSDMSETTFGGSVPVNYLEKYPYLLTLYDGNGFSIDYQRARGHVYALEDIEEIERPKPGASCLSCKTSGFLEILEENGVAGNAMNFAEALASREMETISCYDCHRNTPGVPEITREHLNVAVEGIGEEFKTGELICAQCHVEYYLHPDTKVVTMPSVDGLDVDAMYAHFEKVGYTDWTHPRSGTPLLKVQHPEWETFQDSVHQKAGAACITCHMPEETANGEEFASHHWTSPLKNSVEASCLPCHQDDTESSLVTRVETLQAGVDAKTNETALMIVELIDELEKAVAAGKDEATLTKARENHRKAQWYWDFVFVENSEGFHNNALANRLLDDSRTLIEEALTMLR